jgi:MFS family permease
MYWPIYISIILTSIILGIGAGLLWTASPKYVNECAHEGNKGLYNSIYWSLCMGSLLTGNLMAAFVLPATS